MTWGQDSGEQRTDEDLERRPVAALFVDVSGFTAMVETGDVEEVRQTMRRAFDVAAGEVRRRGGTVEKFIGDAMLALFGAGRAHRDDVDRALAAAAAIRERLAAASPPLQVRGGVELGEVLVDRARLDAARDLMVVGDAVNTAARLQQAAVTGEILVGPQAAALSTAVLGGHRDLQLKGKERPLRAHPLERPPGGPDGSLSAVVPLVGRRPELARLQAAIQGASHAATPSLVVVLGPPGIGKSRLVDEAVRAAGTTLRHAACAPPGEGSAADVLRALLAPDAQEDDPAAWVEALAAAHGRRCQGGEDAARLAEILAVTAGVRPMPPAASSLLWLGRMAEVVIAWRAYLDGLAATAAGTLVLAVDDAQWAPPDLVQLLGAAVAGVGRPLLLLLCSWDEPSVAAWPGAPAALRIELEPLDVDAIRELGAAHGLSGAALEALPERAHGSPLYVETVVRSPQSGGELPLGVRAALTARLDALPADLRVAAAAASVLGGRVHPVLLGAILGSGEQEARAICARLVAEGLLAASPTSGLGFSHQLLASTAYASLTRRERRRLHGLAADAAATSGEDPAELARHLEAAERVEEAVAAYRTASVQAMQRLEVREAERLLGRALALVERPGAREGTAAASLHVALGHARFSAGDAPGARQAFDAALQLDAGPEISSVALAGRGTMTFWQLDLDGAERDALDALRLADSDTSLAEAHAALALVRSAQGRPRDAIRSADLGRAHAAAAGLPALSAMSGMVAVLVNHHAGHSMRAGRLVDAVSAECRRQGLPVPLIWGLYKGGLAHAAMGDFSAALASWETMEDVARRIESESFLSESRNCRGHVDRELGALDSAEDHDHHSLAAALRLEAHEAAANAVLNLAAGAFARGDHDAAARRLDEATPYLDARAWYRWRYSQRLRYYRCLLLLEAGEPDAAWQLAEESLALGRIAGTGKNTLRPALVLEVVRARRDPVRALAGLRRIGRHATRLRLRPIAWRALAAAADVSGRLGDATAQTRHRDAAVAVLEDVLRDVPADRRETFVRCVAGPVEEGRASLSRFPL